MTESTSTVGYSDGDIDTNDSIQPTLESMAASRYSRRQALFRGAGATTMAFMGTSLLAACGDDDGNSDLGAVTVSAGANAATSAGRVVTLTGSASGTLSDSVAPRWTQTSGTQVELSGTSGTVTFIAPAVAAATDLVFTYTATSAFGETSTATTTVRVSPAVLGFTAVPHSLADVAVVPQGYSVTVMTRLGDPLTAATPAYANDGTDTDFANRIGDHHDALHFFGLSATGTPDVNSSTRGLMVQNHENITEQYLHVNGPTTVGGARPMAEALKEIECHGVSVVEYVDAGNRKWTYKQDSTFNRRITPNTPMSFHGPAAGSSYLVTAYSNDGKAGRGTINNCANGVTGWNTNLTCEENYAGYFRRDASDNALRTPRELASLQRNGITSTTGNNRWSTASTTDDRFTRWNATISSATAPATADFRYEPNQFGWVVEIDPFNPKSTPRKRTALGRFGHEGAFVRIATGQKLGVYMGDDSRGEYLYKFVSTATWAEADANASDRLAMGDKYLDAGILYVAKFNANGTGTWMPLVYSPTFPVRPASGTYPAYTFESQADICVNTRFAADALGATPMDRPEWTVGNPVTGEIYLTLTNSNNSFRPVNGTDAANPRSYNDPRGASNTAQTGNPNGHIVRLREDGDTTSALTFKWDIYLFGADSTDADPVNVNISGLTTANDFSSPDGAYFSRSTNPAGQINPVMWIETDDGALTDRTNCMLLAAIPGRVGDGGAVTITNTNGGTGTQATIVGAKATAANLRRFLVGPVQCEITGIDMTPDGRTLFVGIQHPGESGATATPSSHWPYTQDGSTPAANVRPRSALIAITKNDGGIIAL
ncbi:phosphatase [Novosphingobium barchaimii LL02]|uniref:Phosphatase n=1 Tax=Novosphingobium barchaimii LL02 TaxID=1114963 RepID=A0A0J7XTA8_9SPHN|nr:PhoX family phosphatase [Novosphingobium barchaimii]KMS54894.1 phosphatase [Novosphingobium barchaimii LL02]